MAVSSMIPYFMTFIENVMFQLMEKVSPLNKKLDTWGSLFLAYPILDISERNYLTEMGLELPDFLLPKLLGNTQPHP